MKVDIVDFKAYPIHYYNQDGEVEISRKLIYHTDKKIIGEITSLMDYVDNKKDIVFLNLIRVEEIDGDASLVFSAGITNKEVIPYIQNLIIDLCQGEWGEKFSSTPIETINYISIRGIDKCTLIN